jgi:predicted HAD superfamily hydrolase
MSSENFYQNEIDSFRNVFNSFADKKIVIYGIGRRTATLIPYVSDFNLVGLMDRDQDNIGKIMYGLPIVSLETAEKSADVIIINAPQSYWEIIYNRLSFSGIPVYYCNGEKAQNINTEFFGDNIEYWKTSFEELLQKANKYEIISFDLFDTLIARQTYLPQDVWKMVEKKFLNSEEKEIDFIPLRKLATSAMDVEEPNIYDIYDKMSQIDEIVAENSNLLLNYELEIEKEVIVPRIIMVKLFKELKKSGKKVYILSDMYLPVDFLKELLYKHGVFIEEDKLWLSNDKKASKSKGSMWKRYKKEVVKNSRALHIGDNLYSDINEAQKYGIETYYVMNGVDMIKSSSIKKIVPQICSEYSSICMGLFIANHMKNPFALNQWKGRIYFDTEFDLGYGLFGPLVYTYLGWLEEKAIELGINKLYFMSRDGYFLYQNYQYLSQLRGHGLSCDYLEISRRAIMVPSIQTDEDLRDVIKFPYSGTFSQFLQDRFSLLSDERTASKNDTWISTATDYEFVYKLCLCYIEEINEEVVNERENYLQYLKLKKLEENFGVVDLFFYGNNQYYLSKLLNKSLTGFYMTCDLSSNNRCNKNNILYACFQNELDVKAENCQIFKNSPMLESFLTAPNGMLIKIDNKINFIYSSKGKNQEYFSNRENINVGVKKFIYDVTEISTGKEKIDTKFIDNLYGEFFNNHMEMNNNLKEIFFFDNALIQRREMKIFD